jgi:hypothetical protein
LGESNTRWESETFPAAVETSLAGTGGTVGSHQFRCDNPIGGDLFDRANRPISFDVYDSLFFAPALGEAVQLVWLHCICSELVVATTFLYASLKTFLSAISGNLKTYAQVYEGRFTLHIWSGGPQVEPLRCLHFGWS